MSTDNLVFAVTVANDVHVELQCLIKSGWANVEDEVTLVDTVSCLQSDLEGHLVADLDSLADVGVRQRLSAKPFVMIFTGANDALQALRTIRELQTHGRVGVVHHDDLLGNLFVLFLDERDNVTRVVRKHPHRCAYIGQSIAELKVMHKVPSSGRP